jgi:predicted O-linked N-acetylglucosamine transferase (SPINDLY family)
MKVDVCLDTFPYSGTTTTCDSLFVGTPVLTLESDDKNYQNVSKSLLMNSDLGEYVCDNIESYVSKAIETAEKMNLDTKIKVSKLFKENIMNVKSYKEDFYNLIMNYQE